MKRLLTFEQAKSKAKSQGISITKDEYNRAVKKGGITLKKKKQTGSSNTSRDVSSSKALPSGTRLSRTGRIYRETRKNRSDNRKTSKGWI